MHFAVDFGGHHDFVTIGVVLQGPTDKFLAFAQRINIGGIKEVNPQIQGFFDDWATVGFVERPFVDPAVGIAKAHAPQTNPRYIEPGVA